MTGHRSLARRYWLTALVLLLVRYVSGLPLSGARRTDATFWAAGTEGQGGWFSRSGNPSAWSMAPGYVRALVRVLPLAAAWGLVWEPRATHWALALLGGPAVGVGAVRAWRALRMRQHNLTTVRPLQRALGPLLGVPARAVGLTVARGYPQSSGGDPVGHLVLPDHYTHDKAQQGRVEDLLAARLGVQLDTSWRTSGAPLLAEFRRAQLPPAAVLLAEHLAELEAAGARRYFLGMAAAARAIYWDPSAEDPHAGVSARSRRGKTNLLLGLAAQVLRKGGTVTALDPKRVSLLALSGVPGFTLFNDPGDVPGMWAGIAEFRAMMEARITRFEADPTAEFPAAFLICDELNMAAAQWLGHWRTVRPPGSPAVPPVWDDLAAITWQGAQFACHLVLVGQRLDSKATGGQGLRDGLAPRLLAGFTPQQWGWLVGTRPIPLSQKPRGRFVLADNGEETWLQVVYAEETAWRDYALGRSVVPAGGPLAGTDGRHATCDMAPSVVGLEAGAAYLGLTVDAFRARRSRGNPVPGEYRAGNQPAWLETDLAAWAARDAAAADRPS